MRAIIHPITILFHTAFGWSGCNLWHCCSVPELTWKL